MFNIKRISTQWSSEPLKKTAYSERLFGKRKPKSFMSREGEKQKIMTIQIRTKDNLEKLQTQGISYAWRINKGRLNNLTEVEIYNFSGTEKVVGTFDPTNTIVLNNGRVAVAFTNGKIEPCDFKWIGQYPIKYKSSDNQEAELTDDEKVDTEKELNMTEIERIAENLKNNFLFQASLGSKELFHSNLLAWLLEQKNKEGDDAEFEVLRHFIKTVAKVDVPIISNANCPVITREEKNIDLTLKWQLGNDWNLIFIENKMKSIPTPKQLIEYDDKIDALWDTKTKNRLDRQVKKKLLLTPFSSGVQSNSKKMSWKNITYSKEIIHFLKEIKDFEFANAKETNIKLVIEKYISFLTVQNEILTYLNLDESKSFKNRYYDFYSKISEETNEENQEDEGDTKHYMSHIRSLRLHDFVLKIAHSRISELIRQKLEKPFEDKIKSSVTELKESSGNILIASGFTRSTGITDVNIYVNAGISLVLQLQENTLKYAVQSHEKGKSVLGFAKSLVTKNDEKIWFYDIHSEDKALLSGKGKKDKEKFRINENTVFNSYGVNFVYLNKDMKEYQQKPISELVDFICCEVIRVQKSLEKFQNLIPQ